MREDLQIPESGDVHDTIMKGIENEMDIIVTVTKAMESEKITLARVTDLSN